MITAEWRARAEWTVTLLDDQKNFRRPNLSALAERFGSDTVCVANCNDKQLSDQRRRETTVGAYIAAWQEGACASIAKVEYLKDWHLFKMHPNERAYEVPRAFADGAPSNLMLNFAEIL